MNVSDYHLEKAYVFSVSNVETEGTVIYLPIYMCYLLKEQKIGRMIVDLDIYGLLFFASPKYLKLQNTFPKVAAGNSSFLHVSPA